MFLNGTLHLTTNGINNFSIFESAAVNLSQIFHQAKKLVNDRLVEQSAAQKKEPNPLGNSLS